MGTSGTYPSAYRMIYRGDPRMETYRSDIVLRGDPEAVFFPTNVHELREAVAFCHREKKPVTVCGNRTSLTGAPVAESGLLIAMERMNRILDIDTVRGIAVAEPGIILADFQGRLRDEELFYPPDPTSRKEAFLGSTVATNATGEDSLQYGSTRCHIRGLKVLLPNGTAQYFERSPQSHPPHEKNRAGYFLDGDPIDWFIGSEGTLGLITEVTVNLIRHPARHFSGVAFFPSLASALRFVVSACSNEALSPRALEILDAQCLDVLRLHPKSFRIPEGAQAALYFKQEYTTDADYSAKLDIWSQCLENHLRSVSPTLFNDTFVANDRAKQDLLRELRHHIPVTINEQVRQYHEAGGGKVSTDWWVPLSQIEGAIALATAEWQSLGLATYLFGHIGNGHPHINVIPHNGTERAAAQAIVQRQCQRAAAAGGGVSGEHGIGKLKRDLLRVQHPAQVIERMVALKRQFDPHWILGRNTLFPYPG